MGLRNRKILVAEDNPGDAFLAKMWLERMGCVVHIATTGKEAVEFWSCSRVDLILMDMGLPDLHGLEAAKQIRDRETATHRIPIFAVTGLKLEDHAWATDDLYMDEIFEKPFCPSQLALCMSSAMGVDE